MKENEIWKPVVGYEGLYEINRDGIVRTVERITYFKNRKRIVPSIIRKQSLNPHGYYYVRLIKEGKCKNILIHRALMKAFVPNPENKPHIDHINTIKTDNRLENLRWVTPKENTRNPLTMKHITDACANDRCKNLQRDSKARMRSNNYNPKRVYQYSLDGKFIAEYPSQIEATRALGISKRCAGNLHVALDNNRKSAYGYMWTTSKKDVNGYIKPHGKRTAIKQVDENGKTIRTWKSIKDAADDIGVFDSNLSRYIKYHEGHYKGMIFKYAESSSNS